MCFAVAMAVALSAAPPAAASSATIIAPADRSAQDSGFTGPVKVQFGSDLTPGTFTIDVSGGPYLWEDHPTISTAGTYSYTIDPVTVPGGYIIQVFEGSNQIAGSSFSIGKSDAATITAPKNGASFPQGSSPRAVTVHWTSVADPADSYQVAVSGGGASPSCSYDGTGLEGTTTSCALSPLGPATYTVTVRNVTAAKQVATSTFRVVPALQITSTSLAPSPFFPYEHDHFRDTADLHFTTSQAASVYVLIRNRFGQLVRDAPMGELGAGPHIFHWAGLNDAHRLVQPGLFKLTVWARGGDRTVPGTPRETIAAVGLHQPSSAVSPVELYPFKVDGYHDRAAFVYAVNRSCQILFQVRSSRGAIVRHVEVGPVAAGRHVIWWAGHRDNGSDVPVGAYTLRVVASTNLQTSASAWRTVHVHAG